jgi:hypothetical protein
MGHLLTLTVKDVRNVTFPVYGLPKGNIRRADGLVFWQIDNKGEFLLDDRNVPANNIGMRRLKTPQSYKKITPKQRYPNIRTFLSAKNKHFIDWKGVVFEYQKTVFCKVKYHKILEVLHFDTYSAIKLNGIRKPIEVPITPPAYVKYAGVVYYHGHPWMLYDYSIEKLEDVRRKF